MRLGTYSTFDCPTQKEDEALLFLKEEFEKIGGTTRRVMNPHDFGPYPSFEIDYPKEIEDIDMYDEENDNIDEEKKTLLMKRDDFNSKANEIYDRYCEKFKNFL